MCGRYTLTTPLEGVREVFDFVERDNLAPRYNIAPTQPIAAIRSKEGGGRRLSFLHWGLLPAWAKDRSMAAKMINARSETVAEKPSFRRAFQKRRCLIPANGFYEWKTEEGRKQPYLITVTDQPLFAFAGLWESWKDPSNGDTVESATILTTEANEALKAVHHRMPVILWPEDHDRWLRPSGQTENDLALLCPYASGSVAYHRVSPLVNKVANDDDSLLALYTPPGPEGDAQNGKTKAAEPPRQGSLF